MRIAIESFRGEAPRITPRELPENAAQSAVNSRLQTGDLETWRQFALTQELANTSDVRTIYLLNDRWLSWTEDVDVARGAIPGDNTFRVYLTGPEVYDQPRFTNYALATTGAEPFPVVTRPLGVPAPDSQPSLASGVSTSPSSTTIEVIDSGDQLTESWTTNPPVSTAFTRAIVSEDSGNGPPGYLLTFAENVGQPAYLFRDFGVGDSQVVFFSVDVMCGPAARKRVFIDALASSTGAGIGIVWTEAGSFQIGIMGNFSSTGFSALAGNNPGGPATGLWYTITGTIIRNAAGTKTVTATLYLGSVQITTVTVTNAFTNDGGNFGFVGEVSEPTAPDLQTYYDNILVRGTSPTAALQQTATSYVYTFVNDLGEESAPSPPSATVLKDDGTAITVTTATVVPSGFSVDYSVTNKRIYRAVSGATGTVFAFVAEIPLSQADYVDELTDAELGDPLETELYALPPDDLRGILALPNGVMAGFRRNQLCLSVQNRPHAWPVEWRLNTDTDIVCIGNIDTTVVIGTEAFPYLAIGNDPAAYSMTKLEVPQACVAKRSVSYLTGIGVIFASPDGLVAVAGNGKVSNLTEPIFTRRQWQDLIPETILAVAHDDVYHFFTGGLAASALTFLDYKSYALDMKQTGFGLIELGYHALAAHADPLTDKLYLVLDAVDEPFEAYLPLPSTAPTITSHLVSEDVLLQVTFDNASDPFEDSSPNDYGATITGSWTVASGIADTGNANATSTIAFADDVGMAYDTAFGFTIETRAKMTTLSGLGGDSIFPADYHCGINRFAIEMTAPGLGTAAHWRLTLPGAGLNSVGSDFPLQTFSHIALVVPPGTTPTARVYIDGVLVTTFGLTTVAAATGRFDVTRNAMGVVTGMSVDYTRLTKGEVYTSNFTPPSSADLAPQGHATIYEFDSEDGDGDLVQRYKGKLNLLPRPSAFNFCQVKAQDYDNLLMNLYADGILFFTTVVVSKEPFTLPLMDEYDEFELEFVGTSRVRTAQFVEDIRELT